MSEATTVSSSTESSEGESGEGGSQISEEQLKEDIGEGCQEPYSRYRSPKNCNVFIVCANSVPHRFECPDTLNYNEVREKYPFKISRDSISRPENESVSLFTQRCAPRGEHRARNLNSNWAHALSKHTQVVGACAPRYYMRAVHVLA